jgi:hypothetical protein
MRMSTQPDTGKNAEDVASWYFRLNGFLSIPGFVVHPDEQRMHPLTEADLMAVRFPYSREIIAHRAMQDEPQLVRLAIPPQTLFILVEVKANRMAINGPWSRSDEKNMQRAIRRLGFAQEHELDLIADKMYRELRWENDKYVLQYLSVGPRHNPDLQQTYSQLVQITWDHIGAFLFRRFRDFPEKLPTGRQVHAQWPDFGRAYGQWFDPRKTEQESQRAVRHYINTGQCAI